MEKYYTPNIEEFYVGFEYKYKEVHISDNGKWFETWESRTLESFYDLYDIEYNLLDIENDFRVKYLDREDIEECGWESLGSGWYSIDFNSRRLRVWKSHEIIIHRWYSDEDNEKIFQGKINNKSELKRIMKQIGI